METDHGHHRPILNARRKIIMSSLRAWCLRFTGLFHKEQKDREFADELGSHLQMHIEDNLRIGMSPAEARRNALIKLGGIEQTKEKYRDAGAFRSSDRHYKPFALGRASCSRILALQLSPSLRSHSGSGQMRQSS